MNEKQDVLLVCDTLYLKPAVEETTTTANSLKTDSWTTRNSYLGWLIKQ